MATAFIARDDLSQMSVGTDYAESLSSQQLQAAITDLRTKLPTLTDPAARLTAEGNLATLEQEAASGTEFGKTFAPGAIELSPDVLEASIGMSVAAPAAAEPGPITAVGLVRDQLLADYKRQTRAMLLFRLESTAQFLDTVARRKLTNPQGVVSEETVIMLRENAVEANRLGERVWIAKRLVDSLEYLLANEPPPGSPAPEIAGQQTVGSYTHIHSAFNRGALLASGYPPEIPDVIAALDRLGLRPAVTEDEVTAGIRSGLSADEAWDEGIRALRWQGRVTDLGPNVVGQQYEWRGAPATDDEIRAAGLAAATNDPERRARERDLLGAISRPAPSEETDVLDAGAVHPAYNYVALRFVLHRFLAEAQDQLTAALAALDRHLDKCHPCAATCRAGWYC